MGYEFLLKKQVREIQCSPFKSWEFGNMEFDPSLICADATIEQDFFLLPIARCVAGWCTPPSKSFKSKWSKNLMILMMKGDKVGEIYSWNRRKNRCKTF